MNRYLSVAFVTLVVTACHHPQRRNDWRAPAPPMACTSDAECRGGVCTMEDGATKGSCTGAPAALPPLPRGDGGAAPGQPAIPSHQPSSSDIQI